MTRTSIQLGQHQFDYWLMLSVIDLLPFWANDGLALRIFALMCMSYQWCSGNWVTKAHRETHRNVVLFDKCFMAIDGYPGNQCNDRSRDGLKF